MATVPQPTIKAKYARVGDDACTLAKVAGVLYVVYEDRIERFTPQMALGTVLLGDCQVADTQALWDRVHGGAAGVCTSRQMEVA